MKQVGKNMIPILWMVGLICGSVDAEQLFPQPFSPASGVTASNIQVNSVYELQTFTETYPFLKKPAELIAEVSALHEAEVAQYRKACLEIGGTPEDNPAFGPQSEEDGFGSDGGKESWGRWDSRFICHK